MVTPTASVPSFPEPEEYGVPAGARGVERVRWEDVRRRLETANYYWIVTASGEGRPHAVPVGAVWIDDLLFFNMSPQTRTSRNLSRRTDVEVHLESGSEPVIMTGTLDRPSPAEVPSVVVDAYETKYEIRCEATDPELPWYVVRPRKVLAWQSLDIRNTATRWRFAPE